MKFILLALLGFMAFLLWKKLNGPRVRAADTAPPARAMPRPALDEAQQQLYQRLQAALPTTMVLVQPPLSQVLDLGADAQRYAHILVDFAICRKDSTPIGIVAFDDSAHLSTVSQAVETAGLRFVRFNRARLPDAAHIKEALGFL